MKSRGHEPDGSPLNPDLFGASQGVASGNADEASGHSFNGRRMVQARGSVWVGSSRAMSGEEVFLARRNDGTISMHAADLFSHSTGVSFVSRRPGTHAFGPGRLASFLVPASAITGSMRSNATQRAPIHVSSSRNHLPCSRHRSSYPCQPPCTLVRPVATCLVYRVMRACCSYYCLWWCCPRCISYTHTTIRRSPQDRL